RRVQRLQSAAASRPRRSPDLGAKSEIRDAPEGGGVRASARLACEAQRRRAPGREQLRAARHGRQGDSRHADPAGHGMGPGPGRPGDTRPAQARRLAPKGRRTCAAGPSRDRVRASPEDQPMKSMPRIIMMSLLALVAVAAPAWAQAKSELTIALSSFSAETVDPALQGHNVKYYLSLMFDYLVGTTPDGQPSQ